MPHRGVVPTDVVPWVRRTSVTEAAIEMTVKTMNAQMQNSITTRKVKTSTVD